VLPRPRTDDRRHAAADRCDSHRDAHYRNACVYALAATTVDATSAQAHYLCARALEGMHQPVAARYFAEESVRLATTAAEAVPGNAILARILAAHTAASLEAVVYSGAKGRNEATLIALRRTKVEYYSLMKRYGERIAIANGIVDPVDARERGTALFNSGAKAAALDEYASALASLPYVLPIVLAPSMDTVSPMELSMDCMHERRYVDSALLAHLAIVLDPSQRHRRGHAIFCDVRPSCRRAMHAIEAERS
jgi:hypothetical protein